MKEYNHLSSSAGRRRNSRLRLGIEARFLGFDGDQSVALYDLSQTGAKVLLQNGSPVSQGILSWMGYEAFGDVVWRRGRWCGIHFEEELPDDWVFATRQATPVLLEAPGKELLGVAEKFVTGGDLKRRD